MKLHASYVVSLRVHFFWRGGESTTTTAATAKVVAAVTQEVKIFPFARIRDKHSGSVVNVKRVTNDKRKMIFHHRMRG